MARATELVFSVTDRSYETANFLSLLNKIQCCAEECAEKLAYLDNNLPERNHYPSRIMEPVLTCSRFTTSRAKALQRLAFEARLDGSAKNIFNGFFRAALFAKKTRLLARIQAGHNSGAPKLTITR